MRVNGKIRAREVRVIGDENNQVGVFSLSDAINMARAKGVDLVEIAPNATPPVCRLVDFGKFRYEQSKKEKEAHKHQRANKVKEVQLSPSIDPHDYGVKLNHAIEFLCEEMKVKVSLRFRGREMAHKEFGFQLVSKFITDVAAYGHPDAEPKLIGKGINLMLSPLPRNKRGKNPRASAGDGAGVNGEPGQESTQEAYRSPAAPKHKAASNAGSPAASAGFNNPFASLELGGQSDPPADASTGS